MSLRNILLSIFVAAISLVSVNSASASDEGKACKADADCAHGEHCKEGHCHK